jgi:hypothetical protein
LELIVSVCGGTFLKALSSIMVNNPERSELVVIMIFQSKKMVWIFILSIVLLGGCVTGEEKPSIEEVTPVDEPPPVEGLAEEFKERLFQATDEHGMIEGYSTKEELIAYISQIAAREVARGMVDEYYTEKEEGLYIIPKGGPILLNPEESYDLKEIDEYTYEAIQRSENMLHGEYEVTTVFQKKDEGWIIKDILVER